MTSEIAYSRSEHYHNTNNNKASDWFRQFCLTLAKKHFTHDLNIMKCLNLNDIYWLIEDTEDLSLEFLTRLGLSKLQVDSLCCIFHIA